MERLIYRSLAVWPQPQNAVPAILAASVWNNARDDITGALGFSGSSYVQMLEGPAEAINALLLKLGADPRHSDLTILVREQTDNRVLTGWSMAQVDLASHAPKVTGLLRSGDGLALISLLGNLVRVGATTPI